MRVLVACEFSGRIRNAFRALGHDAWSCDYLPPEDGDIHHFQGNVVSHKIVSRGWDLLIAHPDCTFLTVSSNAWASEEWRKEALWWSIAFVKTLWAFPIKRKCIENPIGRLSTLWRKPNQIIQPYWFGHDASKATCLWLDNLPPLERTKLVEPRIVNGKHRWGNQTDSGQNKLGPSESRWAERSRTYEGIAEAMATQWGSLVT